MCLPMEPQSTFCLSRPVCLTLSTRRLLLLLLFCSRFPSVSPSLFAFFLSLSRHLSFPLFSLSLSCSISLSSSLVLFVSSSLSRSLSHTLSLSLSRSLFLLFSRSLSLFRSLVLVVLKTASAF